MSLRTKPFWWAVCDSAGCEVRCPPRGAEITAWGESDMVVDDLHGSGWLILHKNPARGGTRRTYPMHFCPDHWRHDDDDRIETYGWPLVGTWTALLDDESTNRDGSG